MKRLFKFLPYFMLAVFFLLSGCSSSSVTQKVENYNESVKKDIDKTVVNKTYHLDLGDSLRFDGTEINFTFTGFAHGTLHFTDYLGGHPIPYVVQAKINTTFQIPSSDGRYKAIIKDFNEESNSVTLLVQLNK